MLSGFLLLIEGWYCPVYCYEWRPGISGFIIINGGRVLPGFLLLMEAQSSPVSSY